MIRNAPIPFERSAAEHLVKHIAALASGPGLGLTVAREGTARIGRPIELDGEPGRSAGIRLSVPAQPQPREAE